MLGIMTRRAYLNRERALRQIDRRYGDVEPWSVARPRRPELLVAELEAIDPTPVGEYRISTRRA